MAGQGLVAFAVLAYLLDAAALVHAALVLEAAGVFAETFGTAIVALPGLWAVAGCSWLSGKVPACWAASFVPAQRA